MRRLVLVILILLALTAISSADSDNFTINTLYSPTHYFIDYGLENTAQVNSYWINSSKTLPANNSWYLLGSNNAKTIYQLDHRTAESFTADIGRIFIPTAPGYYRYYYLVFDTGFYDNTNVLSVIFNATANYTAESNIIPVVYPGGMDGEGSIGGALIMGLIGGLLGGLLMYYKGRQAKP